ncbi:hypothetical protein OIE68_40045 [Nocardia vinacea]|nr:hypothetical protein OIE68_40045 [Nocardia vinacea]
MTMPSVGAVIGRRAGRIRLLPAVLLALTTVLRVVAGRWSSSRNQGIET